MNIGSLILYKIEKERKTKRREGSSLYKVVEDFDSKLYPHRIRNQALEVKTGWIIY